MAIKQLSSLGGEFTLDAPASASNRTITLPDANVVLAGGPSAGQIAFPATQNASSDPNTLDDYEEGTWTPSLSYSSTNGDASYAVRLGSYIKIGKQVTVYCVLQFTETTASGNLSITGIPFTNNSSIAAYSAVSIDNMTSTSGGVVAILAASSSSIQIRQTATGTSGWITNANTGSASVVGFTLTYITD